MASSGTERGRGRRLGLALAAPLALAAAVLAAEPRYAYGLRYLAWQWSSARSGEVVAADGARLHYVVAGHGPALVFLHGGGVDHGVFFASLPRFARDHRVVALDTRGHGASSRGTAALSYTLYADDVARVLAQLGITHAVLIGWSDGANTALQLALDHPEAVCALVLMSANADPTGLRASVPPRPPDSVLARLGHWLYRRWHDAPSPPARAAELHALWRELPRFGAADLARVNVPTLLVGGEFDLVDPRHLARMRARMPQARLEILPGIGHGLPFEAPDRINTLIADFLHGLPPDACAAPRRVAG
ncbi:MAG: alpha/beta hydrolase [Gammaproteobacteria bacterium]|nr:alpha/beta hydrolase [Gammaproteobacteria bacterium]